MIILERKSSCNETGQGVLGMLGISLSLALVLILLWGWMHSSVGQKTPDKEGSE